MDGSGTVEHQAGGALLRHRKHRLRTDPSNRWRNQCARALLHHAARPELSLLSAQFFQPAPARSLRLLASDAATRPAATTAPMMVQMALISGFTPSRTSK